MTLFGNPITKLQASLAGLALALIFAVVMSGATAKVTWDYQQGKIDATVDSYAKKEAERTAVIQEAARKAQKAQDAITLASALKEATAQTKIVTRTRTLTQEVPRYVTVQQDAVACISYGLVRVLDAAATGRDPSDLELPAGQSDDACTTLTASDLARGVIENYGVAQQNAEQLDALIADIRGRVAAGNAGAAVVVQPGVALPRPDVP